MTCPYLWGVYLHSCAAAHTVHVPGAAELKNYCAPREHTLFSRCPLYRRAFWRSRSDAPDRLRSAADATFTGPSGRRTSATHAHLITAKRHTR